MFKEINVLILWTIVKTDKYVRRTLCTLWRFGCLSEFCEVHFWEGEFVFF